MVTATAACVAGAAAAIAVPAAAATATARVPRGLLATATSWTTAQRGIVLAYPSMNAGAKPYLFETGNGGRTWQSLTAPPVTYPLDHDQPDVTWVGGVIAATDGTHIVATRDTGKRWSAERLAGVSGSFDVAQLVIASGRLFALVTTPKSAAVYSGTAQSGVLRAVPGVSIPGTYTYGSISAQGTLQVDLGADYTAERYWYSRNGTAFVKAPLPCPAPTVALLGGVRSGKVTALCTDPPSTVGLGETDGQLSIAPRLGGAFAASGPVFDLPNPLEFAAASAQDMTVATGGDIMVTSNAGKSWTAQLAQPNGAFWNDLAFPTATTGVIVCSTLNNSSKFVGTVYRTTNAGRTWKALTLP